MKIYEIIDKNYIFYLREHDSKVADPKFDDKKSWLGRKYLGVFIKINEIEYLIPLSSKVKNSYFSIKIRKNDKNIGSLLINNMIPLRSANMNQICRVVDIKKLATSNDVEERRYGLLLKNELSYAISIQKKIIKKAYSIYNKHIPEGLNSLYDNLCCDFKKLEQAALLYKKSEK